jgi:hypothetical protein
MAGKIIQTTFNPTAGFWAMAIRRNHYDTAFEAYLRSCRIPYVAIDETRRALLAETSLKSFDFIVYSQSRWNLLVDVKGRRFPSGTTGPQRTGRRWESWATRDDVDGLLAWQRVFGEQFRGVLVFAYDLTEERRLSEHPWVWEFRQRRYAFYGVWIDEFAPAMARRSPRWETVSLPAGAYRQLRHPLEELLGTPTPSPVSHSA